MINSNNIFNKEIMIENNYIQQLEQLLYTEFPKFLKLKKHNRDQLISQNKNFKKFSRCFSNLFENDAQSYNLKNSKQINNLTNNNIFNQDVKEFSKILDSEENSKNNLIEKQINLNNDFFHLNNFNKKNNLLKFNNFNIEPKKDSDDEDNLSFRSQTTKTDPNLLIINNMIGEKLFFDLNVLFQNSHEIPKGIFVYPLEEIKRSKDNDFLDFFPNFKNFEEYDRIIELTYPDLTEWFAGIPKNLDVTEKIFNPEFLVYCFFKSLCIYLSSELRIKLNFQLFSYEFDKICDYIISYLASNFNKRSVKIVDKIEIFTNIIIEKYKIKNQLNKINGKYNNGIPPFKNSEITEKNGNEEKMNNYNFSKKTDEIIKIPEKFNFENILIDVKKNENLKFSNIHAYRKNYCSICFTYFCSYHFLQFSVPKFFDEFSTEERKFEKEYPSFDKRKINRLKNKHLDVFYNPEYHSKSEANITYFNKALLVEKSSFMFNNKDYKEDNFVCSIKSCNNKNNSLENLIHLIENPIEKNKFLKIIKQFKEKDLYFLFLVSDIFYNACYVNYLFFEGRLNCYEIQIFINSLLLFRNSKNNDYFTIFSEFLTKRKNLSKGFIAKDLLKICDNQGKNLTINQLINTRICDENGEKFYYSLI